MKKRFFRINKLIDEKLCVEFESFLQKVEKDSTDTIFLMFDSKGGELYFAAKMIDMINSSECKFIGVAYKGVHSAAIPIFLATNSRFGYETAQALIHRARKNREEVRDEDVKSAEKQVFDIIARKLAVPIEAVYNMADLKTIITMSHPLGKKFFISN